MRITCGVEEPAFSSATTNGKGTAFSRAEKRCNQDQARAQRAANHYKDMPVRRITLRYRTGLRDLDSREAVRPSNHHRGGRPMS
jgi:hypothetical protein